MPKSNDSPVSARIRRIRGNLKQAEFADILGIPPPNLSRYESGRMPPADILQKIADYGGVSVKWLLTGGEEKAYLDQYRSTKHPSEVPRPDQPVEIQEFLFYEVLREFEKYQNELGIVYDLAHRVRVIVALYNHCARELEPPSQYLVEKFDTDLA